MCEHRTTSRQMSPHECCGKRHEWQHDCSGAQVDGARVAQGRGHLTAAGRLKTQGRGHLLAAGHLRTIKTWVILACIAQLIQAATSIRLEAVLVPQFRFRGQNASLLCKYELEPHEELYSLKWYKQEIEFYRYTPPDPMTQQRQQQQQQQQRRRQQQQQQQQQQSRNPNGRRYSSSSSQNHFRSTGSKDRNNNNNNDNNNDNNNNNNNRKHHAGSAPGKAPGTVQTWKVPGIKIDLKSSLPQQVVLKRVGFKSSGMYRCEVTAVVKQRGGYGHQGIQKILMKESFHRMAVVELPTALPRITGGDPTHRYKPGDLLNLTCISAPSNPPAQLEWRVNGKPVSPSYVDAQHQLERGRGLSSSVIGLLMPLDSSHFRGGSSGSGGWGSVTGDGSGSGQIRVKCRGTIAAEFYENDVENVFTDGKSDWKVLEVQESHWPDSPSSSNALIPASLLTLLLSTATAILSYGGGTLGQLHLQQKSNKPFIT